jgi:hypothetical protein
MKRFEKKIHHTKSKLPRFTLLLSFDIRDQLLDTTPSFVAFKTRTIHHVSCAPHKLQRCVITTVSGPRNTD